MIQQSYTQAYTLRKPQLNKTNASHCSLQHYLQQLEHGSMSMPMDVHLSTDEWIKKSCYIYTMEYYSAIKRNAFESVLMRWMNLKPIIQSEVSQKEKDEYHILTHIFGIQKNGSEEFIYRAAMEKQTQRPDLWTQGEGGGERVRCMEKVTWKLTLPYVKQIANGNVLYVSGNSNRGSVSTQRGGKEDAGDIQEGGDICIPMADSC